MENRLIRDWRDRLRAAIEASGHRPYKISRAIGRSDGYVRSILEDGKDPTVPAFVAICDYIGVSPTKILYEMDTTDPINEEFLEIFARLTPAQRRHFLALAQSMLPPQD